MNYLLVALFKNHIFLGQTRSNNSSTTQEFDLERHFACNFLTTDEAKYE